MLKIYISLFFSIVLVSCFSEKKEKKAVFQDKMVQPKEDIELFKKEYIFKTNASVYGIFLDSGLTPTEISRIVKQAKPVYDLSKIKAGTKYEVLTTKENDIAQVTFHVGNIKRLILKKNEPEWIIEHKKLPTTLQYKSYSGEVTDTLWASSERAGMVPYLITALSEVFSWEIDFSREINVGDRWSFIVEQIMAEGKPVGWGEIIHAEYRTQNDTHRAFYFEDKEKSIEGHFTESGQSMRRMFLKSPLKFGRVTSKFSRRRFHPIRKVYRPHLGVDYGAPRGTPIHSIGDGRIVQVGRKGGGGKTITIQHPGGYKTRYLHMSRFQKGLKVGRKIKQGQTIGFVGSTGLATGAHLHFELFKNNRIQNPLTIKIPSSSSIPKSELIAFKKQVQKIKKTFNTQKSLQL